jgi:glycosyltransferase involved in cell wall biosynthesis
VCPAHRFNHCDRCCSQIKIETAKSVHAVHEAYEWADIGVVPLLPNRHVSGLTVVLEAVTAGKPVIATDTRGLKGYFSDSEVYYVPAREVEALAIAIKECAEKADETFSRIQNAQTRLLTDELTTKGFALRYVRLTEDLLQSELDATR